MRLVYYEFRKLWTQTTKICFFSLILITFILSIFSLIDYPKSILSDGQIMDGVKGIRVVAQESQSLAGDIDQKYLRWLKKTYGLSTEKKKAGQHLGHYIHKYEINSFLNFARKGDAATNYDLTLDWITTETNFYHHYRNAVYNSIKTDNEEDWGDTKVCYTTAQLKYIQEKIQKMKTPFQVTSSNLTGVKNFVRCHGEYYWISLVAIAFCLSGLFSKDSSNGLDELYLATKYGRDNSMRAKRIAGNLFATMIYGTYVALLIAINGLTMTLSGVGNSIQTLWTTCLYPIHVGTGILFVIFIGWLTALFIANLTMLLSEKSKHRGIATLIMVLFIFFLKYMESTSQISKLVGNPLYFVTHFSSGEFDVFYFIGEWGVPYTVLSVIVNVSIILFTIMWMKREDRIYWIN